MNKKNSIKKFIFLGLCCVIGLILVFAQFSIPFTHASVFKGFIRSLKTDADINGGVNVTLTATENYGTDLKKDLKETISRVEAALSFNGYENYEVTKIASNKISIIATDVDEIDEFVEIFTKPKTISVKLSDDDTVYLDNTHLESVTAAGGYTDSTTYSYGVNIKFNEEGKKILADITSDSSKTLSFYLGEDVIFNSSIGDQLTEGSLFVYNSNYNYSDVKTLANRILSGAFKVQFELSNVNTINGVTTTQWILIAVASIAIYILIYLAIAMFYRDFALITLPVSILNFVLGIIICWSVPFVRISVMSMAIFAICVLISILENIFVFNAVKEQYANGKRIHTAMRNALDKTWKPLLFVSILELLISVVLLIFGNGSMFAMGSVLFVMAFVTAFTSIVLIRFVMKWYMPFNSTNPSRLNLQREEK